jgi:hypothetical protein
MIRLRMIHLRHNPQAAPASAGPDFPTPLAWVPADTGEDMYDLLRHCGGGHGPPLQIHRMTCGCAAAVETELERNLIELKPHLGHHLRSQICASGKDRKISFL